jgi:hypothetical protein
MIMKKYFIGLGCLFFVNNIVTAMSGDVIHTTGIDIFSTALADTKTTDKDAGAIQQFLAYLYETKSLGRSPARLSDDFKTHFKKDITTISQTDQIPFRDFISAQLNKMSCGIKPPIGGPTNFTQAYNDVIAAKNTFEDRLKTKKEATPLDATDKENLAAFEDAIRKADSFGHRTDDMQGKMLTIAKSVVNAFSETKPFDVKGMTGAAFLNLAIELVETGQKEFSEVRNAIAAGFFALPEDAEKQSVEKNFKAKFNQDITGVGLAVLVPKLGDKELEDKYKELKDCSQNLPNDIYKVDIS